MFPPFLRGLFFNQDDVGGAPVATTDSTGVATREDGPGMSQAGSITLNVEGEPRIFADQAELQAYLDKAGQNSALVQKQNEELASLRRSREIAVQAVNPRTLDDQIRFYRDVKVPEAEIQRLMAEEQQEAGHLSQAADDGRGGGEKPGAASKLRDGAIGNMTKRELMDAILGELSLEHFDKDSQGFFIGIKDRVMAGSAHLEMTTNEQLKQILMSDKVVGEYFNHLEDPQRNNALRAARNVVADAITKGRQLSVEDEEKVRRDMRRFMEDTYGSPKFLRRASGGLPPITDASGSVDQYGHLSQQELEEGLRRTTEEVDKRERPGVDTAELQHIHEFLRRQERPAPAAPAAYGY